MFDLAYPLTDTVEINGETYDLDLSFDNVLRLIDMLSDEGLHDAVQIELGLQMLLGVELDCDIYEKEKIFHELFNSTIGKEVEENQPVDIAGNPMPQEQQERVYSLKQDAEYIYASFMSDYGIDLFEQQGKLHWFKFRALLAGLTEGSKFSRVIDIRISELPTGKGTSKQREQMLKLKKIYKLKDEEP